jgi:hypothetical protein
MAKLTKAPPLNPVKPLRTAKPPPVSPTKDTYTHHTSPVQGPQPQPPMQLPETSAQRATIKQIPDVPMHVTKHSNPVGRPRNGDSGDGY